MAKHDEINASSISQDEAWVIDSIENAMPPPLSSARIHKVPEILVREPTDYDKYYYPKVVSIGPYHHGKEKLEPVEKLKPVFTKELLSKYNVGLGSLCKKLGEATMVKELRKLYEEGSTDHLSDKEFTRMMLLDGCFILYYIRFIYGEKAGTCRELRTHQIVLVQQDLFLLENQIPFKVLNEMMELIKLDRREKFGSFFADNILAPERQKKGWFCNGTRSTQNDQSFGRELEGGSLRFLVADHLIHRLHYTLTGASYSKQKRGAIKRRFRYLNFNTSMESKGRTRNVIAEKEEISHRCTFRNVNELVDVGIHFKPSSIMSLTHVEFVGRWWWCRFSADVKLPPITVDDSTKPMLLNLIAHEMCSNDPHAWLTSYICLLDSLIDNPEDVKALRKAGVLENSLGSDEEVATLFNEIGTDLVPNNLAYSKAKKQIQSHYESLRNTRLSQLKHEYVKSPWSFLALLRAMLALFLSAVQTYLTVWSPKGDCDDLCMFLKINHRL